MITSCLPLKVNEKSFPLDANMVKFFSCKRRSFNKNNRFDWINIVMVIVKLN